MHGISVSAVRSVVLAESPRKMNALILFKSHDQLSTRERFIDASYSVFHSEMAAVHEPRRMHIHDMSRRVRGWTARIS